MCCHESGILSLVYHKDGILKYLEGSATSIKDTSDPKLDVYAYNGFVFSSNKAIAIVGKKCAQNFTVSFLL